MPPPLTRVSGAHQMPRSVSRSAVESVSSWLLAAPTMARQRRSLTLAWVRMPPIAHGTTTSTSARSPSLGVTQDGPHRSVSARCSMLMSDAVSWAAAFDQPFADDGADVTESD